MNAFPGAEYVSQSASVRITDISYFNHAPRLQDTEEGALLNRKTKNLANCVSKYSNITTVTETH